jgi:hypothetical protein
MKEGIPIKLIIHKFLIKITKDKFFVEDRGGFIPLPHPYKIHHYCTKQSIFESLVQQ